MIDPGATDDLPVPASRRTVREFAGLCVVVFGGLCLASALRHDGCPSPGGWIAGAIALLVGIPGLVRPEWVRPVYLGAMAATRPIGHLLSLGLLAVLFFGLITPLGFLFRVIGRDPLALGRRRRPTYWVPRVPPGEARRYLRQFQQQVPPPDAARPGQPPRPRTGSAGPEAPPIRSIPTGVRDESD